MCPNRQNEERQKHHLLSGGKNIFPEHEKPKQKILLLWKVSVCSKILHWLFLQI